ncbi:MAG TPA: RnfABCDGE type electron transport complex subunit G [Desulfuromonadales bacterium]|nr:RnfABCDGE type electron transport complex subunit G [Desulfuromonadales bacterium]
MKDILRLALVLTLIASAAGLVLSAVEKVTREPIAEQRRLEMLRAIEAVLPDFNNEPDTDTVELKVGTDRKGEDVMRRFFRGRLGDALTGVAFKVVAPDGYSGDIEIMVGVRPDGTVNAIEILNHAETPGLGDKIEEGWFKNQFSDKTLRNVDWRVKKDGGDFDQIAGATISPRAVVEAVHRGLEFFNKHRRTIVSGGGE